ncbi:MAG TPA: A/G-specific adenine glycosylase [Oscillatoriaceae cyanobacterium]
MKPQASALLDWFARARRAMPWRETRDPYHILLSEVMLQQTQVATVIPYFERFVARFPTPEALAAAPEADVLKAWEGLGYYSRARNLQSAARAIATQHGGRVPDSWDAMRALPGVGDYTAGAVLSIAYGVAVPAVDGNVLRVISRLYALEADIAQPAAKKGVEAIVRELQPADAPGRFNEALMELGATVCTPARPRCESCPLAQACRAKAEGRVQELPVKSKKTPPRAGVLAAVRVRDGDRLLLVQRPDEGIWAGLWAFPSCEVAAADAPEACLRSMLAQGGLDARLGALLHTTSHTLTHRKLRIPLYDAEYHAGAWPSGVWVTRAEIGRYALPVPFRKLLTALDPEPLFAERPATPGA